MTPRGYRNNNPLNIKRGGDIFKGERKDSSDPVFKQFETMAYGYRAAFRTLRTYALKHGCERLGDFISRWAPPVENATNEYIRTVCQRTGMSDLTTINVYDAVQMWSLVAAMAYVENGEAADMDDVRRGWELI